MDMKKVYKALLELNDIGKNINSDTGNYCFVDSMLFTWKKEGNPRFVGCTIGFVNDKLMNDLDILAQVPLIIDGTGLSKFVSKMKMPELIGFRFEKSAIYLDKHATTTLTDDDIIANYMSDNGIVDKLDIFNDSEKFKLFIAYRKEADKNRVIEYIDSFELKVITDDEHDYFVDIERYRRTFEPMMDDCELLQTMDISIDKLIEICDSDFPSELIFDDGLVYIIMRSLFTTYSKKVLACDIKQIKIPMNNLYQISISLYHKNVTVVSSYTSFKF